MRPTPTAMSDYPNRKLKAEARSFHCDTRMPAGSWVVPLKAGGALCSASCVGEAIENSDSMVEVEFLRQQAEFAQVKADDYEHMADDIESNLERRVLGCTKQDETKYESAEIPSSRR